MDELTTYRERLAALKTEGERLVARREALRQQALYGRSSADTEAAARALIDGGAATAVVADAAHELRGVEAEIAVNRTAVDMLSRMVGLLELRRDAPAVAAAFRRYMAHVPKVAALLTALEDEFEAVEADGRAFDAEQGRIAGLAVQHPGEPLGYVEAQAELLRHWWSDFKFDGTNATTVERWRRRAHELGVEL